MIVLKANSHRASDKLRDFYELKQSYYHKDIFNVTAKGGFWIVSEDIAQTILKGQGEKWYECKPIKGITKARDQILDHYGKCFSGMWVSVDD